MAIHSDFIAQLSAGSIGGKDGSKRTLKIRVGTEPRWNKKGERTKDKELFATTDLPFRASTMEEVINGLIRVPTVNWKVPPVSLSSDGSGTVQLVLRPVMSGSRCAVLLAYVEMLPIPQTSDMSAIDHLKACGIDTSDMEMAEPTVTTEPTTVSATEPTVSEPETTVPVVKSNGNKSKKPQLPVDARAKSIEDANKGIPVS